LFDEVLELTLSLRAEAEGLYLRATARRGAGAWASPLKTLVVVLPPGEARACAVDVAADFGLQIRLGAGPVI